MQFSKTLLHWYQDHKRPLPWRETKNPYLIWLSEIILQQTRVNQGWSYYEKMVAAFPTVFDLAQADEETVLKLWQGLGYYTRARNLHQAAQIIVQKHQGQFPQEYSQILQLPGIGPYTAAALASIAFGQPQAVVDGNVYRVLSRVFGIHTPIDSSAGQKEFKSVAQQLLDTSQPGEHNQALMEFGALQCTPVNPRCENCVFASHCVAYQQNLIAQLPIKIGNTKIQSQWFHYLVVLSEDGKTVLNKRTEKGIWKNLYEFPKITDIRSVTLSRKRIQKQLEPLSVKKIDLVNQKPVNHKLSHRHLHLYFWIIYTENLGEKGVALNRIEEFPVPVVLQKFITDELLWRIKN